MCPAAEVLSLAQIPTRVYGKQQGQWARSATALATRASSATTSFTPRPFTQQRQTAVKIAQNVFSRVLYTFIVPPANLLCLPLSPGWCDAQASSTLIRCAKEK